MEIPFFSQVYQTGSVFGQYLAQRGASYGQSMVQTQPTTGQGQAYIYAAGQTQQPQYVQPAQPQQAPVSREELTVSRPAYVQPYAGYESLVTRTPTGYDVRAADTARAAALRQSELQRLTPFGTARYELQQAGAQQRQYAQAIQAAHGRPEVQAALLPGYQASTERLWVAGKSLERMMPDVATARALTGAPGVYPAAAASPAQTLAATPIGAGYRVVAVGEAAIRATSAPTRPTMEAQRGGFLPSFGAGGGEILAGTTAYPAYLRPTAQRNLLAEGYLIEGIGQRLTQVPVIGGVFGGVSALGAMTVVKPSERLTAYETTQRVLGGGIEEMGGAAAAKGWVTSAGKIEVPDTGEGRAFKATYETTVSDLQESTRQAVAAGVIVPAGAGGYQAGARETGSQLDVLLRPYTQRIGTEEGMKRWEVGVQRLEASGPAGWVLANIPVLGSKAIYGTAEAIRERPGRFVVEAGTGAAIMVATEGLGYAAGAAGITGKSIPIAGRAVSLLAEHPQILRSYLPAAFVTAQVGVEAYTAPPGKRMEATGPAFVGAATFFAGAEAVAFATPRVAAAVRYTQEELSPFARYEVRTLTGRQADLTLRGGAEEYGFAQEYVKVGKSPLEMTFQRSVTDPMRVGYGWTKYILTGPAFSPLAVETGLADTGAIPPSTIGSRFGEMITESKLYYTRAPPAGEPVPYEFETRFDVYRPQAGGERLQLEVEAEAQWRYAMSPEGQRVEAARYFAERDIALQRMTPEELAVEESSYLERATGQAFERQAREIRYEAGVETRRPHGGMRTVDWGPSPGAAPERPWPGRAVAVSVAREIPTYEPPVLAGERFAAESRLIPSPPEEMMVSRLGFTPILPGRGIVLRTEPGEQTRTAISISPEFSAAAIRSSLQQRAERSEMMMRAPLLSSAPKTDLGRSPLSVLIERLDTIPALATAQIPEMGRMITPITTTIPDLITPPITVPGTAEVPEMPPPRVDIPPPPIVLFPPLGGRWPEGGGISSGFRKMRRSWYEILPLESPFPDFLTRPKLRKRSSLTARTKGSGSRVQDFLEGRL